MVLITGESWWIKNHIVGTDIQPSPTLIGFGNARSTVGEQLGVEPNQLIGLSLGTHHAWMQASKLQPA